MPTGEGEKGVRRKEKDESEEVEEDKTGCLLQWFVVLSFLAPCHELMNCVSWSVSNLNANIRCCVEQNPHNSYFAYVFMTFKTLLMADMSEYQQLNLI